MSQAIERLQAANVLGEVPDEFRAMLESLTDAEVDALISVAAKLQDTGEVAGFAMPTAPVGGLPVRPGLPDSPMGPRPGNFGGASLAEHRGGIIF